MLPPDRSCFHGRYVPAGTASRSLRKEVITMDENKWEYDYSSSNNSAGDTGYPNVGSSGMNTANTASSFSESTGASGGATPPPAQPQNAAPAAPKKPKKSAGKAAKSIVALVLAAAMGFMGGFVGARFGGGSKVVIQQVEADVGVAQQPLLDRAGVADHSTQINRRAARHVGQQLPQQAAGTGFGRGHGFLLPLQQPDQLSRRRHDTAPSLSLSAPAPVQSALPHPTQPPPSPPLPARAWFWGGGA